MGFLSDRWDDFGDKIMMPLMENVIAPTVEKGFGAIGDAGDSLIDKMEKFSNYAEENPGKAGVIALAALGTVVLAGPSYAAARGIEYLRDCVRPVEGSVVYCNLLAVEHSGIYVGDGRIAHLDGSGRVELVSPRTFMRRLGGFNNAFNILVSSHCGAAIGSAPAAARALSMVGERRDYGLLTNNCHMFASECLTGRRANFDRALVALQRRARKVLGATEWRMWELAG